MLKHIKEQYLKKYFQQYIRKDYRSLAKNVGKQVEPWAFIRVKNEMVTMEKSLESILPVIKKGVIGYNNCTDGSAEYISLFCKKNPGFIPYHYKYNVLPPCSSEYFDNPSSNNRLDTYYNSVLAQIPNNVWMIKIDMDHIYDTVKLGKFFSLPRNTSEDIVIANLNLHIEGNEIFVRKDHPFTAGDMLLTYRDKSFNYLMDQYTTDKGFYACEKLSQRGIKQRIYTDLLNYHFPYVKNYRNIDQTNLLKLDDFITDVLPTLRFGFLIPKNMLIKENILNIYNSFNFDK